MYRYLFVFIVGMVIVAAGLGISFSHQAFAESWGCATDALARVRMRDRGDAVRTFQSCLIDLGYAIPDGATGYFGLQTRTALQQFYRAIFGIDHEGDYIGPRGLEHIKNAILGRGSEMPPRLAAAGACIPALISEVRMGQQGDSVQNFQSCLMKIGYSIPAGATGYFGAQTQMAIKEYYRSVFNLNHQGRSIGPQGLGLIKKFAASGGLGTGEGLQRVQSAEELRFYLTRANASVHTREIGRGGGIAEFSGALGAPAPAPMAADSQGAMAGRVSDTNVQVAGIDEPDIIKTDGQNIYFSRESVFYGRPIIMGGIAPEAMSIAPYPYYEPKTTVIKAFPPSDLKVSGSIKAQGEMLLLRDKKILAIFGGQDIQGYSIADPANPQKKWSLKLDDNTQVITSRLSNGKIYVVSRRYLDYQNPCPMEWLSGSGTGGVSSIIIPCIELYRPSRVIPVDSTFTAFMLNPETGVIENKMSFVGSSQDSIVYMSPNALYITYFHPESATNVWIRAVADQGSGLFPADLKDRIVRLEGLDLSDEAKLTEIQTLIDRHLNSLSEDNRLQFQNDWQNHLTAYIQAHRRELEKTAIIKIPLNTFSISQTASILGSVPGYPLNQFALDEYNGNLRIAVTVGARGWGWGGFWPGSENSVNDVYVLGGNLQPIGAVRDLGLTERIYAARFIGPRGYLVTFRQIDPFYVLDLSDPRNPVRKGELKIPGYSAYLEPISESIILGVGQEGSNVKLSLFDVSDPANPIEKDKYTLADSWTEVNSNHRAFLKDDKYRVFFLPGSQGGYIFSYKDNKLALQKAVSGYTVKRAVFLDDYLYVIAEDLITAFDERTWEHVKGLILPSASVPNPLPPPPIRPLQ